MGKKSFLVYFDWDETIQCCTDEELGMLFRALFNYAKNGEEPTDITKALLLVYSTLKATIRRDMEAYQKKCLINSANGKKGGRPDSAKANESEKSERLSKKAKKADIDIDKDIDKDTDKDTDKGIDIVNDTNINKSTSSFSAKKGVRYSEGFLEFWSIYPKKVGKAAAFKSWQRQKLTKSELDNIKQALSWQCNTEQWTKSAGQFIPNPSTYITQHRWEDEPPPCFEGDITNPHNYTGGDDVDFSSLGGGLYG